MNIQHYEKDADGLCARLTKPVEKRGNLEFSVDRNRFVQQGWVIKERDLRLGDFIGRGDFASEWTKV